MFVLLAATIACGAATALSPAAPVMVAAINPRCNGNIAGLLERQVRGYHHPPASNLDALTQRSLDLDSIIQQTQFELDILQNMCTDDERPPFDSHLGGVIAWAYALESDIAGKRFSLLNCPAAASSVPPALLATAWYALASTLNDPNRPLSAPPPSPAPLVAEVAPKIRARAATAGLALPPFSDATQYWRDGVLAKAVGCPSPLPTAH